MKTLNITIFFTILLTTATQAMLHEHKKQAISTRQFFDPEKTVILYQKQACIIKKKSNSQYTSLFTFDLNPCIGIAAEDAHTIGLVHVDAELNFQAIAAFLATNFRSEKNNPIKLSVAAASDVCKTLWNGSLEEQGKRHHFSTQKERIEILTKTITQTLAQKNQQCIIAQIVLAAPYSPIYTPLDYKNTLGISPEGPFQVKLYPHEPKSRHEKLIYSMMDQKKLMLYHQILQKILNTNLLNQFYLQQLISIPTIIKNNAPISALDIVNVEQIDENPKTLQQVLPSIQWNQNNTH